MMTLIITMKLRTSCLEHRLAWMGRRGPQLLRRWQRLGRGLEILVTWSIIAVALIKLPSSSEISLWLSRSSSLLLCKTSWWWDSKLTIYINIQSDINPHFSDLELRPSSPSTQWHSSPSPSEYSLYNPCQTGTEQRDIFYSSRKNILKTWAPAKL